MKYLHSIFRLALLVAVFLAPQPVLADVEKDNVTASTDVVAVRAIHQLAEIGDANAQLKLGEMYASGNGVEQNPSEAAKWYQLAANQKDADAQFKLALMYLSGQGLPQDNKMAASLFSAAAEQGNSNAQYNLGVMLTKEGAEGDYQEAVKWFRKAAEQGHAKAQEKLDVLSSKAVEQGQAKPQENLDIRSAKAANKDIKQAESVSGTSYSLWISPEISRAFGLWGYLLLSAIGLWLVSRYLVYLKLNKFTKKSKERLYAIGRDIPEELIGALSRAKLGMALIILIAICFVTMWVIKEHAVAIILALLLLANIERLFSRSKLALELHDSIKGQNGFFDIDTILKAKGIVGENGGLIGKLEKFSQSKKEKEKNAKAYEDARLLLTNILACLEAIGDIQAFDLGSVNYFCKTGYLEEFCKETIEEVNFNPNENGANRLKRLVKAVKGKACMEKEHAHNLIANYFTCGKVYVKSGIFEFYSDDQIDGVVLCDCCGQVIDGGTEQLLQSEVFCSKECTEIYQKISNEEFTPGEKFVSASRLINYGIDGMITSITGSHFATDQKEFATGGQGHGFIAEKGNTSIDKLKGKDASVVGDDNAKNGADRIVDGQIIQTKYYKTGPRSVGAAFDGKDGNYRYYSNGKPMILEVPKDQIISARKEFVKRIKLGRVPNVTDPKEADNIVQAGNLTEAQAKNAAKFGRIEGLAYDASEVVVSATYGGSISFLLNYSQSYWRTKDTTQAFETAIVSASEAFTKQATTMVLVRQLHRLDTVQALVKSIPIPQSLNPILSRGLNVSQSQVKNAFGGMVVANTVIISLSASKDMFHVINNQMSGRHFIKNTLVTTAGVVGSSTGAIAGKIIGGALGGTIGGPPGAFLGAAVVGHLATLGAKSVLDEYIEDDHAATARLVKYQVKYLADQYLMTPEETKIIVENAIDDALHITPNKSATILINANILPYVTYLVRRRPQIRLDEFQKAGQTLVCD